MKNIYIVEKFKQSFDAEGNEVLTKIDAAKNMPEITASNSIGGNCILANFLSTSISNITSSNNAEYEKFFSLYNLGICQQKFLSLGNYYSSNAVHWTNDATEDTTTKGIVGARFAGEDLSIRTGSDIVVHTMRNRFSAPATTPREVNTIFLGRMIQFSGTADNAFFSSVVLDVPCIQETDEVLIITYRYVFDKLAIAQSLTYYNNNSIAALKTAEQVGTFTGSVGNYVPFGSTTQISYESAAHVKSGRAAAGRAGLTFTSFVGHVSNKTHYVELAQEVVIDLTVNDAVGSFLNSVTAWSSTSVAAAITNDAAQVYGVASDEVVLRRPTDTVVQNTFNKIKTVIDPYSSVATPFYSVSALGNSLGSVSITDDVSSGNTSYDITTGFGELLRIDITTGGVAGVAEYRASTRLFSSFKDASSWETAPGTHLLYGSRYYRNNGEKVMLDSNFNTKEFGIIETMGQLGIGALKPLQLGELVISTRTSTPDVINNGLFLHSADVSRESTELPSVLNSTTIPAFLATDIRGICTAEDGTLFVACADTGLWKLTRNKGDLVADTVATLVTGTGATTSTSCHAVNFGRYGHRFNSDAKLVAAFGTELCVSTDGGTTWNMYNAGTTPAFNPAYTPDSIIGITAHPDHNDVIVTTRTVQPAYEYVIGETTTGTPVGDGVVNQWDGDTGTIVTGIAHMTGHKAVCQYGGANNLCMPVSNLGTYKWAMRNITNSDNGGLYGFNTVSTLVSELSGLNYAATIDFIYDSSVDDSLVLYQFISPRETVASYWESIIAATPELTRVVDCNPSGFYPSSFIAIGRGVFLGTGAINQNAYFNNGYISQVKTAYYQAMRPFHFAWADSSLDFYENNPLNIWYNYGWNGSSWILDDTTSKVSSASSEDLVKGVSAQFVNDISLPADPTNFVSGEIFDTYLFDGVVKDDYTTLSFDTLFYNSLNQVGNEFFPATVPASPVGVETRKVIGVETYKPAAGVMTTQDAFMYFEKGKSSQAPVIVGGQSSRASDSFVLISPDIPDADFSYEFKIGLYVNASLVDPTTPVNYTRPTIILCSKTLNTTPEGFTAFDYGIRPTTNPTNPSGIRLYIWQAGSLVSTLDIDDYNPKTDVFEFIRDDIADTFVLHMNGLLIYQFIAPIIIGKVLKVYHLGLGAALDTTLSSSILGVGTEIFDMRLTFNDQRRIAKIGNGTDTGAWAENFGRLLTLELERGVKKIFLDGVEASIVYDYNTGIPLAGEVKINAGTGELIFNAADAGKTITGEWRYLPSVNK